MASEGLQGRREMGRSKSSRKSGSSTGSESSSTEEEERLRRLFLACDRDRDGYIDRRDLHVMCQQLNMEDCVEEIMSQLGADEMGRISFEEFARCRMQLMTEIEQERMREAEIARLSIKQEQPRTGRPGYHGVRGWDLNQEPPSLYKLLESHDSVTLRKVMEFIEKVAQEGLPNVIDMCNSLHLAALTSLKGEIIDLSTRLQHVTSDKESLEKQLNKLQTEKLRFQREAEDRMEKHTARYEDRITELQSVIAELRKKLERQQINVIHEEEEVEESDGVPSNRSMDEPSLNENNANESQTTSLDIGQDLNAELSRVVTELENAIDEHRKNIVPPQHSIPTPSRVCESMEVNEPECFQQQALRVCKEVEEFQLAAQKQAAVSQLEEKLKSLKDENSALQEHVGRQEAELNRLKVQVGGVREERDKLRRKVRELQTRVQSLEATTSPHNSRTSTPTKSPVNPSTGERTVCYSSHDQLPVAKLAELKKLKTLGSDRQVLGAELSSLGLNNSKMAEHLVQSLQECSSLQEVFTALYQCGNEVSENRVRQFEIEYERLSSKMDSLKAQNDYLSLTLEESKAFCNRLSLLVGKYESNQTAVQIALSYADQALEVYEVITSLLESEHSLVLANCRAAGLGTFGGSQVESGVETDDQDEVTNSVHKAHLSRKTIENVAKQLLQRLEKSYAHNNSGGRGGPSPWEELSSNSQTASTTSSTTSSGDTEWTKMEEQKLRDYIQQLMNDRSAVKLTMMDLESVHVDPFCTETPSRADPQRDLENAVLMQELMAMKEERSSLNGQVFRLEKEKAGVELLVNNKDSQIQAYHAQIEHLRSELQDQRSSPIAGLPPPLPQPVQNAAALNKPQPMSEDDGADETVTPSITLAELRSHDSSQVSQDLAAALQREKHLKIKIQSLVATLENVSRNSELRHRKSEEFIEDLKKANNTLVIAFEKAKKKKVPTATLR